MATAPIETDTDEEAKFDVHNYLISHFKKISESKPEIFMVKVLSTFEDVQDRIRKFSVGDRIKGKKEKVIMLLGATGSGKTTLINCMVNYIMGIKWEDNFRVKLIEEKIEGQEQNQAESQTKWITAYAIHHQPWFSVPYTLTIVDTPGFGDVKGIQRDKEITEQIRQFFSRWGEGGIDQIDAVGFVAQSPNARLTKTQEYIFESILGLFGNDIKDNIFMMLTFADGQKPQVLSAIDAAKIPYEEFLMFNNSTLYVPPEKATSKSRFYSSNKIDWWEMGLENFKLFMEKIDQVKSRSLLLTQEVLKERRVLENIVEAIGANIKIMLNELQQRKTEKEVLTMHEEDIDKNKNFTYWVKVMKKVEQPTAKGQNTTNCTKCNVTCHDRCRIALNLKFLCSVITMRGDCRMCPQKCSWRVHQNQNFIYVMKSVEVTRELKDLKKKYEDAEGKKMKANDMIRACDEKIKKLEEETHSMIQQAKKCVTRFEEIALRPHVMATADYIDVLIENEKMTSTEGYEERIANMKELQKRANYLHDIESVEEANFIHDIESAEEAIIIDLTDEDGTAQHLLTQFIERESSV